MVIDAVRNYLQLATGLTEVTMGKAKQAAAAVVSQADSVRDLIGPDVAKKAVGDLAEELITTSRNNRDLLLAIVRSEAERVIDRVGVATRDEIEALDARVRRLDERLDLLVGSGAAATEVKPAAKKPATKKAPSQKAAVKKAAADPAAAEPAAAATTPGDAGKATDGDAGTPT
jgi:polyhydroxyalkanoate synthesis regulator phasin